MNYPVWYLPEIGGGLLIALIAVLHVFVSHFAVGGGLYLIYSEKKGLREGSEPILEFTKRHARFFLLLTMVFGSITGVGIWFIIALVNPAATSLLIHIFVFGWAAEWVFFVVEIAAAFVYFYMFGRMDSATHLKVGWVYFISAWMSLFLINGIIGFMLTPGDWLENQSFWSGFFNPSFWPSLVFRTCIAVMLAGVYGYLSASFTRDPEVRIAMTRFSAKWSLLALLGALPSAIWYVSVLPVPARELVLGKSPTIAAAGQWGAAAVVVLVALSLVFGFFRPGLNTRTTALAAMLGALVMLGSFEWIREAARRPYAVNEVVYSNMIFKDDLSTLKKQGYLQTALWVQDRDTGPESQLEAGRELFIQQCFACHTLDGFNNDLLAQTAHLSHQALVSYIGKIHEVRYFMPPFAGTQEEAAMLASYIATGLHGKEMIAVADGGTADVGQEMFETHCAACHEAADLEPTTEELDQAGIVGLLARLDELSDEMVPFEGTEEETAALASYLYFLSDRVDSPATPSGPAAADGQALFESECAICHSAEDMAVMLDGWEAVEIRAALDKLDELSDEMVPFEGSPEEKDTLSDFLHNLGRAH
jgi:mono/diheme cytochrome c family protein